MSRSTSASVRCSRSRVSLFGLRRGGTVPLTGAGDTSRNAAFRMENPAIDEQLSQHGVVLGTVFNSGRPARIGFSAVSLFGHAVTTTGSRGFGVRPQRGVGLGLGQLFFEIS